MAGALDLADIAGPLPPSLDIVSDALRILGIRTHATRAIQFVDVCLKWTPGLGPWIAEVKV